MLRVVHNAEGGGDTACVKNRDIAASLLTWSVILG